MLTTEELVQTPRKNLLKSRPRSPPFCAKVDFLLKNGSAPVRTESANIWE